jgi:Trk-type K+ transport system membrane component
LIQVGINLLSWVLFILLNLHYAPVTSTIPDTGQRVMDGLYQAHGLRAAGYYIISISDIAPALQIFYLVVMYISAYPFIMSVRQTNVYEERSLGIDNTGKSQMENRGSGSSLLTVSEILYNLSFTYKSFPLTFFPLPFPSFPFRDYNH